MTTETIKATNITEILSKFNFDSNFVKVKPFGSGHINDTYLIEYSDSDLKFLLQRINHHVFKNVDILMDNITKVTTHIRKKVIEKYHDDSDERSMVAVKSNDEKYYYQDTNGSYWRVFNYLDNTKSYDIVTTENQAFEGGKAFGEFQAFLVDLPTSEVKETIVDFHNIQNRLINLQSAIKADSFNRVNKVLPEINLINSRANEMEYVLRKGSEGKLPLRVIHNDTKFNNVLLNQADQAQCVIDLDTVMPGYVAYDFGDAIRTIINTASEDEKDLSKININLSLYSAFTTGYLTETINFLEEEEIKSLAEGAILFPYMQAVRFLTDFIEGDHYYKTEFEGHNLQRAKAQLKLFSRMDKEFDTLKSIVQEVVKTLRSKP
ncbi:phosphotransferase enzyme family protein [Pedobacter xixiisoli]|uniref:Phosphotransferase enzyme family protein n=1 Tax=Pedobacter xixiisoli TaxID=1476464 RepID=A0A285ZPL0_9SPHI|nr:phosphotransferase [Pedobacter xixiisoli]SOD11584.1 Phosphotransferase enzyme family protein [Pedobacter xixiisoli]